MISYIMKFNGRNGFIFRFNFKLFFDHSTQIIRNKVILEFWNFDRFDNQCPLNKISTYLNRICGVHFEMKYSKSVRKKKALLRVSSPDGTRKSASFCKNFPFYPFHQMTSIHE